jgi:hypothetical protein
MRTCLFVLALAAGTLCAADLHPNQTLRGKLGIREGKAATLETSDHKIVTLEGDDPTLKVLADTRLNGFEVEAHGRFTAPDRFLVNPSHTHSMLVRKDGKLKLVTYWCDICSIRSYTPGPCVCCQKDTALDLRDPDAHEH